MGHPETPWPQMRLRRQAKNNSLIHQPVLWGLVGRSQDQGLTVTTLVLVTDPYLAVMVTFVDVATALLVNVVVAFDVFAGIVIVAGTGKTVGLLLVKDTDTAE